MAESSEISLNSASPIKVDVATLGNSDAAPNLVEPAREDADTPTVPGPVLEEAISGAPAIGLAPIAEVAAAPKAAKVPVSTRSGTKKAPIVRAVRRTAKKMAVASDPWGSQNTAEPLKPRALPRAKAKPEKSTSRKQKAPFRGASGHASADIMDVRPSGAPGKATAAKARRGLDGVFEKSVLSLGRVAEFASGNVTAMAESGKILSKGLNELANGSVADGRCMLETFKADARDLAAIRSPAALLKYQANILSRNLRTALELGSKNRDAIVQIAKDTSAPVAGRFAIAAGSLRRLG